MSEKIAHYRSQCVSDFNLADEGSINIKEYAKDFGNHELIYELQEELQNLIAKGLSPEGATQIAAVSRKLDHEIARALFPYRYARYGTNIFGSARLEPDDEEFQEVTDIAKGLVSESRIDINTGGGPGIMQAANLGLKKGAEARKQRRKKNGAQNNGFTVTLPFEENPNGLLDEQSHHDTFGTRLNEFADKSNSTISWDGGGGTDLENAYVYQLKQVGHVEADYPIILKRKIWEAVQEAKMKSMYHARIAEDKKPLVSPQDLGLVSFADHPDDAVQAVLDHYDQWKRKVWSKLDENSKDIILNQPQTLEGKQKA